MRFLLLLSLTLAATAAQVEIAPTPWKGLWAVDAAVELPGDAKQAKEAKTVGPVRRYYMRDPSTLALGERTFLVGKGVVDWQETVAVPLDSVVALAQFVNNQVLVQTVRKEIDVQLQVEKGKDVVLEPNRR